MKRLFDRLKRPGNGAPPDEAGFFSSMFHEMPDDPQQRASWPARAAEVGARPMDRARGLALFTTLWQRDRHVVALRPDELNRLAGYLEFVEVGVAKEVIGQDELGNYMMLVLEGTLSVDRVQPWGARARLAEAHAGDLLGEMSLLDAGARFSSCVTLSPCAFAVIDTARLDEMATKEPRLALALLATLSRRLSLRLRQVSARLSAVLSQD